VPEDWLMFSRGYDLGTEVPGGVEGAFDSPNPWIQVVAITLAAESGDFGQVDKLLEIATQTDDWHLRDCALRVFSQAASPSSMGRLAVFFDHPEYDARITAYQGAMMSGHLPLARALAACREGKDSEERSLIEVRISSMLEPLDEGDFVIDEHEVVTDKGYQDMVARRIREIEMQHGPGQVVQFGQPMDVFAISGGIRTLLEEDDAQDWGGAISDMLDTLEGLLGISTAACMTEEVEPIMPAIHDILASLRRDPKLLKLVNGRRSFFCHTVD
jgi:hypothetical protein